MNTSQIPVQIPEQIPAQVRLMTEVYAERVAEGERLFQAGSEYISFSPTERAQTLLHRWERMVEMYGTNTAVAEAGRTLSYAESNALANRIAHALLARKLPNDLPVGLLFAIEGDMPIGMLAAWKAGNFVTWLEPRQPLARNEIIVEDSGALVVVTNRAHAELARQLWPAPGAVIVIEELAATLPVSNPPITLDASQPAYLVYTSGSTGTPKGSLELHGNLVQLMVARETLLHFNSHDRVAFLLYGVGIVFALAAAWMYGGCFLPFDAKDEGLARFSHWLITQRITFVVGGADVRTWLLTLDGSEQFPDLRFLSLSTGPTYREHLQAYQRYMADGCLFANLYSATEFRFGALYFMDKQSDIAERLLPAGYATPPGTIEVWDEEGRTLPANVAGEIVIISPYLSPGYWKSPELTASKFGRNRQGRRYFRTGDLGRVDAHGCLWVLGRIDGFVKIRGNRVETAEIEVALLELTGIVEAAVIAQGETDEERVLVGIVATGEEIAGNDVRKQLAARLPEYMIPGTIVVLDELPRNANGKVARPLLREMAKAFAAVAREARADAPAFRSDTERRIATIVCKVLGDRPIGRHDNFFDQGGHSLMASQLMLQVFRTFAVDLAPRDFYADPTIAGLAAHVETVLRQQANAGAAMVQARSGGMEAVQLLPGSPQKLPVFFCLGWNGAEEMLLRYHELIWRLDRQWPLYGLMARGTADPAAQFETVEELVAASLAAIRQVQPRGPYLLLGECLGGKLAYEMARTLEQQGEAVALLMMLDTPFRPKPVAASPLERLGPSARSLAHQWARRIDIHWQRLASLDLKARTQYVGERLAARLPSALYPQSSYRPRFLAHKHYAKLLLTHVAREPYRQPATLLFTHTNQTYASSWTTLIANAEVHYINSQHDVYLRAEGDEVAALVNRAVDATQRDAAGGVSHTA